VAEPWSAQEGDRPFIRPVARTFNPWIAVVIVAIVWLAALGVHSFEDLFSLSVFEPTPRATPLAPELGSDRPAPTTPAGRVLDANSAAASLPRLENSDSMMRDVLSGLVGRQAFAQHFIAADIVRRIVATVDSLPRATAARRVMPLNPVPGMFIAGSANYERYTPYARVFDAIDAQALVQSYVRAYPLFQRAYEELGFPGKYFNDRLMETIDDLLDAPELATPPEFMRPRVLYEFADPDLETRSAGQKMLLRMGRDNAARVKAKLREIRRELTKFLRDPARPA
jgi:hypothetical protein